jgi:4-amino-4-deoxy-L-arabinose transferase-like glycosyltransferase
VSQSGEAATPSFIGPRSLVAVTAASLAIRLALWFVVADCRPIYDETGYLERAAAMRATLAQLAHGARPPLQLLADAYGGGVWPPLQSMALAAGLLVLPNTVAAARLVVVLLSALTTPLVYLLTLRLSSPKAATWAAWVHAIHPLFLGYSTLLWSETLFTLLTLLSIHAAVGATQSGSGRAGAAAGLWAGLSALTRGTGLPTMVILPIWLAWRARGRRGLTLGLACLATSVVVILPWEAALRVVEGRFVPLSTSGGLNLFLGNNQWMRPGETWYKGPEVRRAYEGYLTAERGARPPASGRQSLHDRLVGGLGREYSPGDIDRAARVLAVREIADDPVTFAERTFWRATVLLSADTFILRSALFAVYPPMPEGALTGILVAMAIAHIGLIALGVRGLAVAGRPLAAGGLLVLLVVAGAALPAVSVAQTRFAVPLLALLIPPAGHALAYWREDIRPAGRSAAWICALLAILATVRTVPLAIEENLASAYYRGWVGGVDALARTKTQFDDEIRFRCTAWPVLPVEVTVSGEGYALLPPGAPIATTAGARALMPGPGVQSYQWTPTAAAPELSVDILGREPNHDLALGLVDPAAKLAVPLYPGNSRAWWEWRPTGLPGIEYRWIGRGHVATTAAVRDE